MIKAGCDFILPDVHLLSVYLLVKVLQEGKKRTIKMDYKCFIDFQWGKKNNILLTKGSMCHAQHCTTFWTEDYFIMFFKEQYIVSMTN